MVTLGALWLPILLSAVFVWISSAIIWTLLPYHTSDYRPFPNEEALRAALKEQNAPPGQYSVPHMKSGAAMKDPANVKKFEDGPVGYFTILPNGVPAMGGKMLGSFVNYLVVAIIIAYLTSRALMPGSDYLDVFRIAGTSAWLAYGFAIIPDAIWFGRPWSAVAKNMFDALIYALLTAGTFGWLWPGGH